MSQDNNTNDNGADAIGAVFDRATRLDLILQAHGRQGSEAVGDIVGNTRSSQQGESLMLNTASGKVSRQDGTSFDINAVNSDDIDWSQVDLPDNGVHIPAERARLQREVFELEQKANAVERYDQRTGQPIYRLNSIDRANVLRLAEGKKVEVAEALKELDRLQAQRDRRATLGQAWDVASAEREARIERMTHEELERLEAQKRAQAMFNRNKSGGI
jgi:hypothetical protein